MLLGLCFWCSCAESGDENPTASGAATPVEVREDGIVLFPDFAPIPFVQFGRTASETDASEEDPECAGWIARQPGHVLRLGASFDALRLTAQDARGVTDLVLVMETPDGNRLCADDGNGLDPVLESALDAGVYRVWIGTLEPSTESHEYTLGISRSGLSHGILPRPPPDPNRLSPSVRTSTGDLHEEIDVVFESGLAGGRIEASELGEHCTGWISEQPDFGVAIRDATDRDNLAVRLRCRAGVGLVLMLPDGSRICGPMNGDGEERTLTVSPVVAGRYDIWLSSPDEDSAYECWFQLGG